MSQTSDNSRTFRVLNLTDAVKESVEKLSVVVTQHENVHYLEVPTIDGTAGVRTLLDNNQINYKQCSYSTFVRSKESITVDELKAYVSQLCSTANVLYLRVDENNHTGKLVVDRLEDYNLLKNNTGNISFYRFSPLNVPRVQNRNYHGNQESGQSNEWQQVNNGRRSNGVRANYTQNAGVASVRQNANSYANQTSQVGATTGGPTRGATGGRGGFSSRGGARGGAARGPPRNVANA